MLLIKETAIFLNFSLTHKCLFEKYNLKIDRHYYIKIFKEEKEDIQ
jgi:hypothetical protein